MKVLNLRRSILLTVFAAAAVALGACANTPDVKPPVNSTASPSPSVAPSTSPVTSPLANPVGSPMAGDKLTGQADTLVGRWPGVEGSYLDVSKKADKYSVAIKNLDGVETFEGTAKGDLIEFTRKGKTETVRAATAEETGMKWLAGEKNCVVVTKGSEGFCRK